MPAEANGMVGGVATHRMMVIRGQTLAGARVHFTIGSDEPPGVTRSFDSFHAASLENAWSRIWLGVHLWLDETAALSIGDALGNNIFHQIMGPSASGR